jgi:hypothetical protein
MVVVLPQHRIPCLGVLMTPSELDAWGEDVLKLLPPAPPRHSSRSRLLKDSMWPLSVGLLKQQNQPNRLEEQSGERLDEGTTGGTGSCSSLEAGSDRRDPGRPKVK